MSAHPKTQNTVLVASGSSVIDVDSTIGFPDKGQIQIDGKSGILTYRSKTIKPVHRSWFSKHNNFGTNYEIAAGTELNLNVVHMGLRELAPSQSLLAMPQW